MKRKTRFISKKGELSLVKADEVKKSQDISSVIEFIRNLSKD